MSIKTVAILGANSQIAQDYTESLLEKSARELFLFSRNSSFLIGQKDFLPKKRCETLGYEYFGAHDYDLIINFVGASDPKQIAAMGPDIFNLTDYYDNLVLEYLKKNTNTIYIFISSGAAYGNVFSMGPAGELTNSIFDLNNLFPSEYYGAAKYLAEQRHRALAYLNITDLRIFSYFSERQDLKSSLLMAEVVQSIQNGKLLKTNQENIFRDYIGPDDFYNLIEVISSKSGINASVDSYSLEPVGKIEILNDLKKEFGLPFLIDREAIGSPSNKKYYYSLKKHLLTEMGYSPRFSSLNLLKTICRKLLKE